MERDLERLSELRLLRLFAEVLDELKDRGVLRSRNNPVGDYSEQLAIRAFGLNPQCECPHFDP